MEKNKNTVKHTSMDEWIARMKLAFTNGKMPEIQVNIAELGYNEERLDILLESVNELEILDQNQKKEYAEQYAGSARFEEKRKEINALYMKHLSLCRILFKGNVKAESALEFKGKRKSAYGTWFQQVSNFYAQLLDSPEFLSKLANINIEEPVLRSAQAQLREISALKEEQKKEIAAAQKSTEIRDKAFDKIYPEYSKLIAYSKVILSQEQHLEAMGIVVKR